MNQHPRVNSLPMIEYKYTKNLIKKLDSQCQLHFSLLPEFVHKETGKYLDQRT